MSDKSVPKSRALIKGVIVAIVDAAVAVGLTALLLDVRVGDVEAWPTGLVLALGCLYFVYGGIRAYLLSPSAAILAAVLSLGLVCLVFWPAPIWQGFPLLWMCLAGATTVVLAPLKAVVDGILSRYT